MTREEAKGNIIHAIRWNDMPKKEALEFVLDLLEQTEWIPVSERLPRVCRKLYDNDFCNYEASDRVLITVNAQNNIFLDIATYTNKGWIGSNRYGLNTVVAWMPLLELYRGEE